MSYFAEMSLHVKKLDEFVVQWQSCDSNLHLSPWHLADESGSHQSEDKRDARRWRVAGL